MIAASVNFPVLLIGVLWKDWTTKGAVIGGFLGLASSVALTVMSPSVWEATLGNPKGSAWFPYTSPALFSMTIAFVGIWLFSKRSKSALKPAWVHRAPAVTDTRLWVGLRARPLTLARTSRSVRVFHS